MMHLPEVLKLDARTGEAEEYFLPPERLVSGNPRQTAWVQYTDPTKQFFVGIWRSEPGKWKIAYTEEEYCEVLEGISTITDSKGATMTVRAGDHFVIPRGFSGTWEVVETTRKRFVIFESSSRET